MTEASRIYADLLRLRYQISDYLDLGIFDLEHSFGKYISIHETTFTRIINDKENPGLAILYRLEEHCNGIIEASIWWKLVTRKIENDINQNKKDRRNESRKVKNRLKYEKARL